MFTTKNTKGTEKTDTKFEPKGAKTGGQPKAEMAQPQLHLGFNSLLLPSSPFAFVPIFYLRAFIFSLCPLCPLW
jgi:hypothetical protein